MLSAGVLGIVVLIVFFLVLDSGQKKQQEYDKLNEQREVRGRAAQAAAERRREEGLAQLEERRRKAAAPPQRSDASPVPGCSCTLPAGDPVALAAIVQHNATMAMGGTVKKQFGLRYFLDEGDQHFVLQSTGTAAPPAAHEGIALDLAMGCDADTVAIVGPTSVSGWSTRDGSLRWTTPFSTRFGVERFVEGELAIACHPTRVQAGVMSLVAEPGGPDMKLSVRLSDGKLL
jgi:hypothetical protein